MTRKYNVALTDGKHQRKVSFSQSFCVGGRHGAGTQKVALGFALVQCVRVCVSILLCYVTQVFLYPIVPYGRPDLLH